MLFAPWCSTRDTLMLIFDCSFPPLCLCSSANENMGEHPWRPFCLTKIPRCLLWPGYEFCSSHITLQCGWNPSSLWTAASSLSRWEDWVPSLRTSLWNQSNYPLGPLHLRAPTLWSTSAGAHNCSLLGAHVYLVSPVILKLLYLRVRMVPWPSGCFLCC